MSWSHNLLPAKLQGQGLWVKDTGRPFLSGQWYMDGGECIGHLSSQGRNRKAVTEIKTPLQTGGHHG